MGDSDSDFELEVEVAEKNQQTKVEEPAPAKVEIKADSEKNASVEGNEVKEAVTPTNKKEVVEVNKSGSTAKSSFDALKERNESKTSTPAKKEKEPNPCFNFRLDPTASFGTCKCGWPKASHGEKKSNKAAELVSRLKAKNSTVSASDDVYDAGDGACAFFRLDTAATEFGMCKCGYKRSEHVVKKKNKAQEALERLKSSNNIDLGRKSMGGGEPCDAYKTDTAAKEFGVCIYCGFKKEEHGLKEKNKAAQMLENLKKKNEEKRKKEDELARGVVEEEIPEEPQEPVETLDKKESQIEADIAKEKKKKKKKNGKKCVIC